MSMLDLLALQRILHNGVELYRRKKINFIGGTVTEDPALDAINVTLGGGGGGGGDGVPYGGDLEESADLPNVVGLRGRPLGDVEPSDGEVLTWGSSQWAPAPLGGGPAPSYVAERLTSVANSPITLVSVPQFYPPTIIIIRTPGVGQHRMLGLPAVAYGLYAPGACVQIKNAGPQPLDLLNEDDSRPDPTNRFHVEGAAQYDVFTLAVGEVAMVVFDETIDEGRWLILPNS